MHGYAPGATTGGVGVFLLFLSMYMFLYSERTYKKLALYCTWTFAFGIVITHAGTLE